ncbi:MAG TPA: 3-keto-5-aminohexanoate cleavage protein [Streptosporangiaceae bacterium]|nr:3-keto-5-aminohexanoate cleavage protein [Streptosporangiaceae bacterium]
MLIKACLNGGTTREQHAAVPITPAELAADARDVARAGAGAIHVHPRDASGNETLEAEAVLAAVHAVRAAVPHIPVGVTTGIWAVDGDPERRLALVAGWTGDDRPDFASVNLSEPGTNELAATLAGLGIPVEAGIWTAEDVERLAESDFAGSVIRILIEPHGDSGTALATAMAAEEALDRHGIRAPRLHHAYQLATWHVIQAALRLGRDIRIGLEDTTVLPDGSVTQGNGELVAAAVRLAAEVGRQA